MNKRAESRISEGQNALLAPGVFGEEEGDAALVVAADRGSHEAFEVLVRRHHAKILRVAWRFSRNREDAEDITQQTFQKAFVHLQQFQKNSSFCTWLTRIAMNEGLMWLRRKRGSFEVSLDAPSQKTEPALHLDPPDPSLDPEETLLKLERKQIVSTAINKLTPKLKMVVRMQELGELSIAETAGTLGLSVGTVKARLFHGRKKLRTILKHYVGSASSYGKQALRSSPSSITCQLIN